jgi:hypothetical protein
MTREAGGLVDVADLGGDTDWIAVSPLEAGITNIASYTLSYRRLNGVVYLSGRVTGLTAATQTTIASAALPAGFRPGVGTVELGIIANGASTKARVFVQSNGNIGGRTDSGTDLYVFGSFIADA